MIWGCDPASKKIALFSGDDDRIRAEFFQVKPSDRNTEILSLRDQLLHIIKPNLAPVTIYCEEPVVAGARNLRSTILIAETVGMILGVRAYVRLVPVSSWKKATVGKGNATKEEVANWLQREYPDYAQACGNQDLVDAAAIYLYGRSVAVG